ncbi:hypothetical protein [Salinispora arenicola]|uniref:hypothetical protein n=1 Tax=Salinispora arenicola TaxID=168697 RepID=UPI0018AD54AE|nr:hypothetical protein [Salinispora arenicola]
MFKQRARFERLALAGVAHRIGEDSILIVMASTIPARHIIDKAIPTRRPGAAEKHSLALIVLDRYPSHLPVAPGRLRNWRCRPGWPDVHH